MSDIRVKGTSGWTAIVDTTVTTADLETLDKLLGLAAAQDMVAGACFAVLLSDHGDMHVNTVSPGGLPYRFAGCVQAFRLHCALDPDDSAAPAVVYIEQLQVVLAARPRP